MTVLSHPPPTLQKKAMGVRQAQHPLPAAPARPLRVQLGGRRAVLPPRGRGGPVRQARPSRGGPGGLLQRHQAEAGRPGGGFLINFL